MVGTNYAAVTGVSAGNGGNGSVPLRLVFFDYDGTLLNNTHDLLPTTVGYIRKLTTQGINIVSISGRAPESMMPYMREMGIESQIFVSHHGARIEQEGRVIESHSIPAESAVATIREVDLLGNLWERVDILYFNGNVALHRRGGSSAFEEYTQRNPSLTYVPLGDGADPENFSGSGDADKLVVLADSQELASELKSTLEERLEPYNLKVITTNETYVEIVNQEATKGNAVKAVLSHFGIKTGEAVGFGDGESDISMATEGGIHLYLLGNAPDDLKARVSNLKRVTVLDHTNQDDAVGRAIAEILLQEDYVIPGN